MAKPPNYTVGARRSSRMSYVCYKKKYLIRALISNQCKILGLPDLLLDLKSHTIKLRAVLVSSTFLGFLTVMKGKFDAYVL